MKFIVFTDIHHWDNCDYANILWEGYVNTFWQSFIEEKNKIKNIITDDVDFIINLWDLIRETKNKLFDTNLYIEWLNVLKSFWKPVFSVAWNHDVDYELDREGISKINWYEKMYYSFELSWYTHIVLDWNREWKIDWEIVWWQKYHFDDDQIFWLENTLENSENNCIIYCHFPIDDQDISKNPYWPTWDTTRVFPQKYEKVRQIIEKSNKVIAYFNWHTHFPHISLINWILYCNIGSFSENNWNWEPTKDYALVEVKNKDIKVSLSKL